MSGTATETSEMHEKGQSAAPARLQPAISIFIVPAVIAVVAALPSVLVLLMIHALMGLLSGVVHQPIRLFDGYFYVLVLSPAIFLSVPVFVVMLVGYFKSARKRISREGREGSEAFEPQLAEG